MILNVKLAKNYLKCEIADGSLVHLLLSQFLLDLDQGSLILSFIFDLNKQAPEWLFKIMNIASN